MKRIFAVVLPLMMMSMGLDAAETGAAGRAGATTAERYAAECGTCHLAYPAGFLPERSWKRVMGGLADHFGDNAELSDTDREQITQYLIAGAGDHSQKKRPAKFAASIPAGEAPLRITEVPYFKREHREIPQRYITGNAKVGSLSNCAACHTRAEQGSFREREIDIPGVGRWDD